MKDRISITAVVLAIAVLSLLAAGIGIGSTGGPGRHEVTTIRGESVLLYGRGIYANDSVAAASQAIAQDWVTLLLGIPLLIVSLVLTRKGQLRARLLLAGTLAYFLYTYMSYSFLCTYNALFLVYVGLMSVSFFAFMLVMLSFDMKILAKVFRDDLPVKTIGISIIVFASAIGLMWLGRLVPPLVKGDAPAGLEHYTTYIIQAMDLGFIIPVSILSAILLMQKKPLGLLLASVMCMKGVTMLTALSAMILFQWMADVPMTAAELVVFPAANVLVMVGVVVFLKRIREPEWKST
ncbi:hypothetical protein [Gorillibacterium timonense]|uniref:hypothetical protein n=1 Tax=Gorillibacterium timonense TaxID=1689269 RepID=UPI00071D10CC|nr:hypothetical protein [Gorillibacterium timonense]